MNKHTLSNLTHAHGWLGVIFSGLLFLIFFAGAISLFKNELYEWSVKPTHEIIKGDILTTSQIMEIAIEGRLFNAKEHLSVIPPSHDIPYYRVYVDLIEDKAGQEFVGLLIHPVSGKIISEIDDFFLADFIYHLHMDLNIPNGLYILGVVTLFFFFMVISGIFIHAKKVFSNFFHYRTDSNKRSQLLDMHNVIGTISLPFTVMYAISGLIFNLVIVYQISFAVILYKGDQAALFADAGINTMAPVWNDQPYEAKNIDKIIAQYSKEFGQEPMISTIQHYGDSSATMQLIGQVEGTFAQRYELGIELKDENILFKDALEHHSEVRHGTDIFRELHFGSFAGVDVRLVYLFLSFAVCTLIVTGNLLWIEKRQKRYKESQRSVKIMTKLTLISTLGVGTACCIAFVIERLMPVSMVGRADFLVNGFIATLVIAIILSFIVKKQQFLVGSLFISGAALLLTVACDYILYGERILALLYDEDYTVFGIQIGLCVFGIAFIWIAKALHIKQPLAPEVTPEPTMTAA